MIVERIYSTKENDKDKKKKKPRKKKLKQVWLGNRALIAGAKAGLNPIPGTGAAAAIGVRTGRQVANNSDKKGNSEARTIKKATNAAGVAGGLTGAALGSGLTAAGLYGVSKLVAGDEKLKKNASKAAQRGAEKLVELGSDTVEKNITNKIPAFAFKLFKNKAKKIAKNKLSSQAGEIVIKGFDKAAKNLSSNKALKIGAAVGGIGGGIVSGRRARKETRRETIDRLLVNDGIGRRGIGTTSDEGANIGRTAGQLANTGGIILSTGAPIIAAARHADKISEYIEPRLSGRISNIISKPLSKKLAKEQAKDYINNNPDLKKVHDAAIKVLNNDTLNPETKEKARKVLEKLTEDHKIEENRLQEIAEKNLRERLKKKTSESILKSGKRVSEFTRRATRRTAIGAKKLIRKIR